VNWWIDLLTDSWVAELIIIYYLKKINFYEKKKQILKKKEH